MTGFIFLVDLDGTLTRSELLPLIAKRFNLEKSIADLTYQCVWGKIPFAEGFLRRIDMLKSIPISHIKEIIDTVVLNESLVSFMQHNVDSCYIVTGNLDVWVKPLCDKLKIPSFTSIAIHENNFIQGVKSVLNKRDIIQKLKKNFSAKRFIAIGEGHNDAEMMELADVSIAYGGVHAPANSVMETASHVIFDEETLCTFLKQLS
ncbi:MAG: HAD-IB family phosphatase [Pseudomonadota bacterium]